jgi:hypothetical protein
MDQQLFELLEQTLRSEGPSAGFDFLIRTSREQKNYPLLLEARLMQTRHKLGLPLLLNGPSPDLPAYQAAMIDVARETGSLFLADGDILHAWPYFRAIGDPGPVTVAIENLHAADDGILQIALNEGVNPSKGFELLLERHGVCRAIDFTLQYPDRSNRTKFLQLLVRTLHAELAANLKEGQLYICLIHALAVGLELRRDRSQSTERLRASDAGRIPA